MKTIDKDGVVTWRNPSGDIHREGSPAMIEPSGMAAHFTNGEGHSLSLPREIESSSWHDFEYRRWPPLQFVT